MTNKLVLDSFEIEPFYLCGIHSSLSAYKMAYLLNTELKLRFARTIDDVEVLNKKYVEFYPKYVFEDNINYTTFTLIKNKCYFEQNKSLNNDLFSTNDTEQVITNLIPEFKKVDFFLKIETDEINYSPKLLISKILKISQVITAFEVDYENLKSKNNLIFE